MIDPILITGCARSGTSLVAGIIDICGAFGGKTCGETKANKKGQFENNEIRTGVTKPYLKSLNCDPLGQSALPSDKQIYDVTEEDIRKRRNKVLNIMISQGLKDDHIWYIKEAKSCLNWYLWHKAFPNAKWVIVRRKDNEIIDSCLNTSFMKTFQDRKGWQNWISIHKRRFGEMIDGWLDVKEIWSENIVNGDFLELEQMINWLELEYKEKEIRKFVSPELWHFKR